MKKPAKAAPKKVVKNNNHKKPQKPQKKIVAKPAPKKVVKVVAKKPVKAAAKKPMFKAKVKAPVKNKFLLKKKPLTKAPPAKKDHKKEQALKKAEKLQAKMKAKEAKLLMFKKNKEKEAAKKEKDLAKKSKEQAKKSKEADKNAAKAQKENEKKLKLQEKENAKLEAKRQKQEAKDAAKKAKMKGKKGASFEGEEDEEGGESKPRFEEDDDLDDDFTGTRPTKMVFDDEFEDEIPVKKKKASVDDNIKDSLAEEILALTEEYTINDVFGSIRSMELFKIDNDECVVRGCDNPSTTNGYCRYHYLKLWKDVKKKEQILQEGKLAKIIEELVRKYPMKYIEAMVQDLADDKSFNHVLKDLDIETEEADLENFDDEDLLDDDQDIAFETKVVKPSFDD